MGNWADDMWDKALQAAEQLVDEKRTSPQERIVQLEKERAELLGKLLDTYQVFLEEAKLREEHPGLKELWNEYQTMLALVRK